MKSLQHRSFTHDFSEQSSMFSSSKQSDFF